MCYHVKMNPACRLRDLSSKRLFPATQTRSREALNYMGDLDAREQWLAPRGNVRKVVGSDFVKQTWSLRNVLIPVDETATLMRAATQGLCGREMAAPGNGR